MGQEFQLPLAEFASLIDSPYVIIFEKVLEDSRCARGATCVWEGNARVQLNMREYAPMGRRTIEVLDLYVELDTHAGQARQRRFADYVVELRGLEPYPGAGTQTGALPAYVATLFVDHYRTPPATQGP